MKVKLSFYLILQCMLSFNFFILKEISSETLYDIIHLAKLDYSKLDIVNILMPR